MACDRCRDDSIYAFLDRLADDVGRHAALFRCPACRCLFEILPDVEERPTELTEGQARARFPGAL